MEPELYYYLKVHEKPNITVPFAPGCGVQLRDFPFQRIGKHKATWWTSSELDMVIDAIRAKSGGDKTEEIKFDEDTIIEWVKHLERFGCGLEDEPVYVKVRTKEQASLATYILKKYVFNYVVVQVYHEYNKTTKEDIEKIFKDAGITLYLSDYSVPEYASENYDQMKPILVHDNILKNNEFVG